MDHCRRLRGARRRRASAGGQRERERELNSQSHCVSLEHFNRCYSRVCGKCWFRSLSESSRLFSRLLVDCSNVGEFSVMGSLHLSERRAEEGLTGFQSGRCWKQKLCTRLLSIYTIIIVFF